MSKFVFFFCAFLLIGAVCADDADTQTNQEEVTPNYVEDAKNKLIDMINGAIKQINDKVREVLETTSEYAQKIKDESIKVATSVFNKIRSAQQKVKFEAEKILKEAVNVNVTECAEMAEAFDHASLQVLAEVSRCVTDVIEDADGYIASVINSSDIVLKNLTNIKDEAELCVKDVDGIVSTTKALYCINVAAVKGTWAATKDVPSLFLKMGKLTFKISALLPKLTACSTIQGIKQVNQNSSEIVQKVRKCVEAQKALAASNNTQK